MTKIRFALVWTVGVVLFCSAVFGGVQAAASDPAPPAAPPPPHAQFFAGTVVEMDGQHIKVTRTLVGRPTESRSFGLNAATKMNKSAIKMRSRVTVRYKRLPEGDVALEIQLRPVVARTPKV